MLFSELLKPFLDKKPLAVMTRACFEHPFASPHLDALFQQTARNQRQHRLPFSTLVQLLGEVITRQYRSLHEAYRSQPEKLAVSLASLYDKLNHTEPAVSEALVQHTAQKLQALMQPWSAQKQPISGLSLKILDGNFFAGTDKRLQVTRKHGAAALPGMVVCVQDHASGLITHVFGEEDGYANERAVAERYLEGMQKEELLVGDRLYCFGDFLQGIEGKESYFIIRHHGAMALKPTTELSAGQRSETGMVFEQQVQVGEQNYRLIVVQLDQPTREKESEIRILSNLSPEQASAVQIAQVYRLRWRLEGTFCELTQSVRCELKSLGYPKAALLTFALAVCAVNALRVVTRTLEESQGKEHPKEEVSSYYVVNELILVNEGMDVVVEEKAWEGFRVASAPEMAEWLLEVAKRADWKKYRKSKRGPKKEVEKVKATKQKTHRSTFRLLEAKKSLPKSPPRP